MNPKVWLILSALLGASGVSLGAFHAHGLAKHLERRGDSPELIEKRLDQCGVAVQYQMVHVLALLGVGLLAMHIQRGGWANFLLTAAGLLFLAGMAMFSGGLYLIVFAGNSIHWSIVPLGGLALIVAWLALAVAVFCMPDPQR